MITTDMTEADIKQALMAMRRDTSLKTEPAASNPSQPIHNQLPFEEIHLAYLLGHPKVNVQNYLANLRVMIKVRA